MTKFVPLFVLVAGSALSAQPPAQPPEPTAPTPVSEKATFLISKERLFGDPVVGWKGLFSGLRGFEHFYEPVGNPIYFESPFNTSGLRFLFLHHEFPNGSQLQGGHVDVYAVQARIAITERWQFIATKDGYSELKANALPADHGWNDIAAGGKYLFYVDKELDLVAAGGARWQWANGNQQVLQGNCQEISPYISAAKGWDQFHLVGDLTYRLPFNSNDGNSIFQWDLHADYEVAPSTLPGFAPMVELHGLHYLSNGTRSNLSVGGMDYANLGSTDVAGSSVIWIGVGARWKLTPNTSIGADYEYPLNDRDGDIMGSRFTVDFQLTW